MADPTLMSFSSLQARAVLFTGPTVRTGTGLRASPSREAALTFGGVSDAAAQPIATPARVQPCAALEDGCVHTAR